jgi:antitoxin VapB
VTRPSDGAARAHETKTPAVRVALRRGERLVRILEEEAWPQVPADVLGEPVTRADREGILGYGPDGV